MLASIVIQKQVEHDVDPFHEWTDRRTDRRGRLYRTRSQPTANSRIIIFETGHLAQMLHSIGLYHHAKNQIQ